MFTLQRLQRIFAFALCLGSAQSVSCEETEYVQEVKRLIRWLPAETESLMVLKGDPCGQDKSEGFDPSFPCGTVGALHVIRKGKFRKQFVDRTVVLAANASCRFRGSKKRLSMIHYSGCQVVVFEKEMKDAADDLLKTMAADADESLTIKGREVLLFKEKHNRDDWTFFVTFPTPRVLLVATDKDYLRDLLKRIDDVPEDSFLKDERLEAALPLNADLWAVRRYKGGPSEAPLGSIGFVFELIDFKKAEITFFAEKDVRLHDVAKLWARLQPVGTPAELKEARDGVFKFRHSRKDKDKDDKGWSNGLLILLTCRLGYVGDI